MTQQPHQFTLDQLELASINHEGFCVSCGDLAEGIEASARNHVCPGCGQPPGVWFRTDHRNGATLRMTSKHDLRLHTMRCLRERDEALSRAQLAAAEFSSTPYSQERLAALDSALTGLRVARENLDHAVEAERA